MSFLSGPTIALDRLFVNFTNTPGNKFQIPQGTFSQITVTDMSDGEVTKHVQGNSVDHQPYGLCIGNIAPAVSFKLFVPKTKNKDWLRVYDAFLQSQTSALLMDIEIVGATAGTSYEAEVRPMRTYRGCQVSMQEITMPGVGTPVEYAMTFKAARSIPASSD